MKYPMFKVHIDVPAAMNGIEEVLTSGFVNEGEQVLDFTQKMVEYFDFNNIIPLNSCTSALTLALKLAGVESGDEVISTSMTCVATNTPIHNMGAKIIWADIDRHTGNIDPEQVLAKITFNTKAVLCVNWVGLPCDLKRLQEICTDAGIKLIQDGAHGFGAKLDDKHVCHFADYTCYSLQAIKHVTTGDGGLLMCKDDADYERAKKLKWFGIDREATKDEKGEWKGQRWEVDVMEAGYKFHMNNITAAIGLSQIDHIDTIVSKHIDNAELYTDLLHHELIKPLEVVPGGSPAHWVMTLMLDERLDRDSIIIALNEMGIGAGLVHTPNHNYTCFAESMCDLPETDYFSKHQISLPCGWWLSAPDVVFIAQSLLRMIEEEYGFLAV